MSIYHRRSNETDSYEVLTSYNATPDQQEELIVSTLVKGLSNPAGNNTSIPDAGNQYWDYKKLIPQYVNTSALYNTPAGTVTQNSAISLEHVAPQEPQKYSIPLNVDSTKDITPFELLGKSSPFYDANINFTHSYPPKHFDGASEATSNFSAEFDHTNAKSIVHYARNSALNTKPGPYNSLHDFGTAAIGVTEDADFNTTKALGQMGTIGGGYTSYYAVSGGAGGVEFLPVDTLNQPLEKNFLVVDRGSVSEYTAEDDIGIFKYHQSTDNSVAVTITADGATVLPGPLPLMNPNLVSVVESTTKHEVLVPSALTTDQFYGLFNDAVLNTVADGFEFTVSGTEAAQSGYHLPTGQTLFTSFDNTNILDNPHYIMTHVDKSHTLTLSPSTLTVNPAGDSAQGNAGSIDVGLTEGEKLPADLAGVDGGLYIQTNTKTTRTDGAIFHHMAESVPGDISVSYGNESTSPISTIMEQNPHLHVSYKKVALMSQNEPKANVFLRSNGASLSLYTNQLVNQIVDKTDTIFTFNNNLFSDDKARVWKVNAENSLVAEPESFYKDEVSQANLVPGVKVSSFLTNLTENAIDYDEYRHKLTAKTLDQLSLHAAVAATGNWSIGYTGDADTFLKSSSVAAFGVEGSMPQYSPDLIQGLVTGATTVPYSYTYQTGQSSDDYSGIKDSVIVNYTVGSAAVTYTMSQKEIKRTYTSRGTPNCTVVAENDYSFTGGNYTKDEYELVMVTRDSVLNVSFSANFSIFTNVKLSITNIQQTDTYHAIRHKSSGALAGHKGLKYVSYPGMKDLKTITETIAPSSGGILTISGTLTGQDLKGFTGVVQAKKNSPGSASDNTWEVVSATPVHFDTYYGLDNIQTLSLIPTTGGASPDVSTRIEFDPFCGDQEDVNLTAQYCYIPLYYDANDIHYNVSSFTGADDATSQLSNVNDAATFFSPVDNYAASVKNFVTTSEYTVSVSNAANVTTVSVWKNVTLGQMQLVFEIIKPKNKIFLGCNTVSYISSDIWYAKMTYGQTAAQLTSIEGLFATTYPGNMLSCHGVAPGVDINVRSPMFPAGCRITARIMSDYVAVNPVRTLSWTSNPTHLNELGFNYNFGNLVFKYTSGDYYSATITLRRYRGFNSGTNPGAVQAYSISRSPTIATFTVGNALSQVLTSNMYAGEWLTVNQLKTTAGTQAANLNIKSQALYSIPPVNSPFTYDVTLVADDVTVTISNTSYVGGLTGISVPPTATPVETPTSYSASSNLRHHAPGPYYPPKSFYTFSAARPLSIASARIKIRNAAFAYGNFAYKIKLSLPDSMLYKAIPPSDRQSFLGNPALIPSCEWGLVATLSGPAAKRDGFSIGRKRIRQSPMKYAKGATIYYTSAAPQYTYESVVATSDLTPTYMWENLPTKNKRIVKLSYDGTVSVFNPFAPSYTIKGVNGSNVIITNDSVTTNNITYTHLQPKSLNALVESPITQRVGINVGGVNLKIEMYSGLDGSTYRPHLIFDGQITTLPTAYAIGTTHITFDGRDLDGSVNFSIAQHAEDAGYASDMTGYQKIFKTTDHKTYYNLNFKMGNPCWNDKTRSTIKFNAAAGGIRATLYTVMDVNDTETRVNSRRVSKYISAATYKIDDSTNSIQASNFSFTLGRSYCDIVVNQPPFSTHPNYIWDYSTLLATTNPGAITWTPDTLFTEHDVSIGWVYGNSVTAENMPVELFYVDDTASKWVNMTCLPFQKYTNQYGLTNAQIAWDGSLYSPLLSTKTVSFQPQAQVQNITTTYQLEQYSITSKPKEAVVAAPVAP